jgi:hypothetical protein
MPDRPAFRELRLTSPFMKSELVKLVQTALGDDLEIDGEYGPATAASATAWQWRVGAPKANGILTPVQIQYLLGYRPIPAGWQRRATKRVGTEPPAPPAEPETLAIAADVPERAVVRMERWAGQGVMEQPAGANQVPVLAALCKQLGLSSWYQKMGWPWCCHAGFLPALEAGGVSAKAGYAGKFNVLYTVSILDNAQAARHGMRVVGRSQARRGDIGLVNFPGGDPRVDHFVRLREAPTSSIVKTVEGNTSSGGTGSQDNGGMMALRERPIDIFRAFVRDS